ncbi:MAG TPA: urea carboxylase, partial [Nitrosomonas sp.]|nr:urea carboxylase [Nitrosomonas sp.]
RQALIDAAIRLGRSVNYQSAGTVEFLVDAVSNTFYFLEVNTRLQVEHGVTEMVTGVDLVEWMVRQASADLLPLETCKINVKGSAIQVRLYAENPAINFQPSSGLLTDVRFPATARVETWIERGIDISPFYDPMLAKIIVHESTREQAISAMQQALDQVIAQGIETNLEYLTQILGSTTFHAGQHNTRFLDSFRYYPHTIDVLSPGVQTTIQDYPGRLGYWQIGVPPSGPMDALAFRLANQLVGNPPDKAGLEITFSGPTLRFNCDSVIAITGAEIEAHLDGKALPPWQSHAVKTGAILKFGKTTGHGCRTYLAIQDGIRVTEYLGSKSTFIQGQFGGHTGRPLHSNDVLHIQETGYHQQRFLTQHSTPRYSNDWKIGVMYGPHGAPDYFTEADIQVFFSTSWTVHHNSDRTGIRLLGPKPEWARSDGGEAGLHPSNIHDNAYAIGTIDFTGDMPVILGPDGPSLGGFVCPATVVHAELWKLGQLRPGDTVRFYPLSMEQAATMAHHVEAAIAQISFPEQEAISAIPSAPGNPVLHTIPESTHAPAVIYRQAGDKYLLIEYGPVVLDFNFRLRAHALMNSIQHAQEAGFLSGIIDLTPGIRSLQIHYDAQCLPRDRLLQFLIDTEAQLSGIDDLSIPSRIVHLPLSWDDAATKLAIEKYMQSVRSDAPWCPSNIEFIRRINGLDSIEAVQRIVFDASYLVLGLGDVYLGAPVATPVDPRHRLVTTKYNPARTWTPENAVGIGGAYLCIYGMEGPGGYQFVGRTVQMWNRFRQTSDFKDGKPWLLRFFDQIRFYPVSESELLKLRKDFIAGKFKLRIEETMFSLREYNQFIQQNSASIQTFKLTQQAAFDAERERWRKNGQPEYLSELTEDGLDDASIQSELDLPEGMHVIGAHITGTVWKILVTEGDRVTQGAPLVVVESMKMEFMVEAPVSGAIRQIFCQEGGFVAAGQMLMMIHEE